MDSDISGMLRQMMENPQFGAMVDAVKTQMGGEMDPSKMMEKLPEMMTILGPALRGMGQSAADGPRAEQTETKETAHDGADGTQGEPEEKKDTESSPAVYRFKTENREKRNTLLCALKPYLSPARCALVDRAISAIQLGELLGTVMTPKS